MKYKIADLIVEYETKYDQLKKRSEKNKIETDKPTDIQVIVKEEYVLHDLKKYADATRKMAEIVITGRLFYQKLLDFQGCLLHASCVVIDDKAYLFSADSGTGKSTHTGLWLQHLADKNPYILNDDKPAIRVFDDGVYAYGTPFSGKHDISENKKVKVQGICFLEQSKINFIQKLEPSEAIKLFLEQTTNYLKKEDMEKLLDVLEVVIKNIPIYKLYCDISKEAVELSYHTMKGEDANES